MICNNFFCNKEIIIFNSPLYRESWDDGEDHLPPLGLGYIITALNNKVSKALFNIRGFLKNPLIPIPFKRNLISSIVIGRVAYFGPLLGSNKNRTKRTQQFVNKGLYWIAGSKDRNSFVSIYNISKELNIPPLLAKCVIAQVRCFKK